MLECNNRYAIGQGCKKSRSWDSIAKQVCKRLLTGIVELSIGDGSIFLSCAAGASSSLVGAGVDFCTSSSSDFVAHREDCIVNKNAQ